MRPDSTLFRRFLAPVSAMPASSASSSSDQPSFGFFALLFPKIWRVASLAASMASEEDERTRMRAAKLEAVASGEAGGGGGGGGGRGESDGVLVESSRDSTGLIVVEL